MKTGLDHLPPIKQHELRRIVEIIFEEFEDALKGSSAEFKKKGRILKIILFGSYGRGTFVDEPHTKKGYRSDYDLLIVVNNKKLTDIATYWHKTQDRLLHLKDVKTPVSLIVHSRREVNASLREGLYFFVDIARDGVILHELDDEPLAAPKRLTPQQAYEQAKKHFAARGKVIDTFVESAVFRLEKRDLSGSAFMLHQAVEHMYGALLLTLTNYSPPSHNLNFLRSLAEDTDQRLVDVWPRDQHRFIAWYNILNEAYVKARYSEHYDISQEALAWLTDRAAALYAITRDICETHISTLGTEAERHR